MLTRIVQIIRAQQRLSEVLLIPRSKVRILHGPSTRAGGARCGWSPTLILLGQAAGLGAAQAARRNVAVQEVDFRELQEALRHQGQIDWQRRPCPPGSSPISPRSMIVWACRHTE